MKHGVAGSKLNRSTSARRSLLRNLVTSVIDAERVQTTIPKAKAAKPAELTLTLGDRQFTATPGQPAFLVVRLTAGPLAVGVKGAVPERIAFTPLPADHVLATKFTAFEKRVPQLGVHMGFRRDCGRG